MVILRLIRAVFRHLIPEPLKIMLFLGISLLIFHVSDGGVWGLRSHAADGCQVRGIHGSQLLELIHVSFLHEKHARIWQNWGNFGLSGRQRVL